LARSPRAPTRTSCLLIGRCLCAPGSSGGTCPPWAVLSRLSVFAGLYVRVCAIVSRCLLLLAFASPLGFATLCTRSSWIPTHRPLLQIVVWQSPATPPLSQRSPDPCLPPRRRDRPPNAIAPGPPCIERPCLGGLVDCLLVMISTVAWFRQSRPSLLRIEVAPRSPPRNRITSAASPLSVAPACSGRIGRPPCLAPLRSPAPCASIRALSPRTKNGFVPLALGQPLGRPAACGDPHRLARALGTRGCPARSVLTRPGRSGLVGAAPRRGRETRRRAGGFR